MNSAVCLWFGFTLLFSLSELTKAQRGQPGEGIRLLPGIGEIFHGGLSDILRNSGMRFPCVGHIIMTDAAKKIKQCLNGTGPSEEAMNLAKQDCRLTHPILYSSGQSSNCAMAGLFMDEVDPIKKAFGTFGEMFDKKFKFDCMSTKLNFTSTEGETNVATFRTLYEEIQPEKVKDEVMAGLDGCLEESSTATTTKSPLPSWRKTPSDSPHDYFIKCFVKVVVSKCLDNVV